MSIAQNLAEIRGQIQAAALAAGREPNAVRLIAVSKTHPIEAVKEAFAAGQTLFGENRVQEMTQKHPLLPQAEWHLIGQLQTNKVKYITPFVSLIHSVDSEKLLQTIDAQAQKHNRQIACLFQINISDEEQKAGMEEAEAVALLKKIDQFPNVSVQGFMGMAALTEDRELIRSQFRRLSAALAACQTYACAQHPLKELSMGMSGDFDLAIAEGATLVRVGTAIFGSR